VTDANYLTNLKKFNRERGAFAPFSGSEGDIPAIRKIKDRINSIVEKELVLQDFKDQLDKEALTNAAYKEVVTKQNFYFQVDETKV
jgi:hypothetical protein